MKIWDYQTKACVQTLEGHTHNVSAACFHPELPIILSGSEDGTLRIWHANTYRLENILNYSMERLWSLGYVKGSNRCTQNAILLVPAHAFAFDGIYGTLVALHPVAWAAPGSSAPAGYCSWDAVPGDEHSLALVCLLVVF